MKRYLLLFCLASSALIPVSCIAQQVPPTRKSLAKQYWSKLREGDIVFIRSRSANAPLIAALSNLNAQDDADDVFTHCGIVFRDADGQWKVYEGAGRIGIRLTLTEWQSKESKDGPLHNLYVLRWNGQPQLTGSVLEKVVTKAKILHDTHYDNGFSWTDSHAYCSELVWKAFDAGGLTLCDLPNMGHYVDAVPAKVADKIKERLNDPAVKRDYRDGKNYDPKESAISPEDIFRSAALIAVTDDSP
jgi:hypothetical protein